MVLATKVSSAATGDRDPRARALIVGGMPERSLVYGPFGAGTDPCSDSDRRRLAIAGSSRLRRRCRRAASGRDLRPVGQGPGSDRRQGERYHELPAHRDQRGAGTAGQAAPRTGRARLRHAGRQGRHRPHLPHHRRRRIHAGDRRPGRAEAGPRRVDLQRQRGQAAVRPRGERGQCRGDARADPHGQPEPEHRAGAGRQREHPALGRPEEPARPQRHQPGPAHPRDPQRQAQRQGPGQHRPSRGMSG